MPPFGTAENPAAARRCGKPRATGAASLPTLLRSCLRLCRGVVQTVPLCVLFRRCVVCRCLWRPASFTENSLNMAPFGSPSVPAGSSGPHSANPAAGRRLSSAEPLRVSGCSLVSDGNVQGALAASGGRAALTAPLTGLQSRHAVPTCRVCAFCQSGDDHHPGWFPGGGLFVAPFARKTPG